jgi:hypothetical protein
MPFAPVDGDENNFLYAAFAQAKSLKAGGRIGPSVAKTIP